MIRDELSNFREKVNIVGTPGSGFGPSGEGYFRLTAFGSHENTRRAVERFKNLYNKSRKCLNILKF